MRPCQIDGDFFWEPHRSQVISFRSLTTRLFGICLRPYMSQQPWPRGPPQDEMDHRLWNTPLGRDRAFQTAVNSSSRDAQLQDSQDEYHAGVRPSIPNILSPLPNPLHHEPTPSTFSQHRNAVNASALATHPHTHGWFYENTEPHQPSSMLAFSGGAEPSPAPASLARRRPADCHRELSSPYQQQLPPSSSSSESI